MGRKTKRNQVYLIYMYKNFLALNNRQCLICHKTPTKPKKIEQIIPHLPDLDKIGQLNFNLLKLTYSTRLKLKMKRNFSFPP